MSDRYVVRFVSGFSDEVEAIDTKPDVFEGEWEVWVLDYSAKTKNLERVARATLNMANVEKVQELVERK